MSHTPNFAALGGTGGTVTTRDARWIAMIAALMCGVPGIIVGNFGLLIVGVGFAILTLVLEEQE